jgi:hypothetical protein
MTILQFLLRLLIALSRTPSVRMMVYLCFNALSKTAESLFIRWLPMDMATRYVFEALHILVLAAMFIETVNMLWKKVFGVPLFESKMGENKIDDAESLLLKAGSDPYNDGK